VTANARGASRIAVTVLLYNTILTKRGAVIPIYMRTDAIYLRRRFFFSSVYFIIHVYVVVNCNLVAFWTIKQTRKYQISKSYIAISNSFAFHTYICCFTNGWMLCSYLSFSSIRKSSSILYIHICGFVDSLTIVNIRRRRCDYVKMLFDVFIIWQLKQMALATTIVDLKYFAVIVISLLCLF